MEPTTIYLILSITINILFFLLFRKQESLEQLYKQIVKEQEKQIKLLKELNESKKKTEPNYPKECQIETLKDITCP